MAGPFRRRPSQNRAAAISRRMVTGESRHLVFRQAVEVAELDDLRLPRIEDGQLVERLVRTSTSISKPPAGCHPVPPIRQTAHEHAERRDVVHMLLEVGAW